MDYRLLGKSGLKVSELGFGGIPLQRVLKKEAHQIFKCLQKANINFVDTAKGYGLSEALIGHALSKVGRGHFVLATKAPETDYEGMWASIYNSLSRLQVEKIDLYQIHNVRLEEKLQEALSEKGALRALKEAKEKGLIGHIGITSHSLSILEKALKISDFETIQYPYNFVEGQGEALFQAAFEKQVGVICMKPMAGGAISRKDLSLKYVLQNPNVSVAIPGVASCQEIEENLAAVLDKGLSQSDLDWIERERKELGAKFCRRCSYCAPCTQGIDIPSQFVLFGYKKRYGLADWAEERYAAQAKKASDCISCGVCESRCPYDLPIAKMLAEVKEGFESKSYFENDII